MRPPSSSLRRSAWLVAALMIAQACLAVPRGAAASRVGRDLQLDVQLGGHALGLIGAFHQSETGALSARRAELEELGIKVPPAFKPGDEVPLAAIPGLSYRYDENAQRIDLHLPEAGRLPKVYDASPAQAAAPAAGYSTIGAVLNYTLFGNSEGKRFHEFWRYPGLSASLDARLFSSFGVLSQTGIVSNRSLLDDKAEALRLDSTWSYSDPATLLSYRAGDTISGGLAWTRPIRLGGLQVQRNFALRPDLITLPLPSVNGSAAVPSTVDVFVNGVRTISQDVGSGPFRINNVPILSGNGNASIVVRDASGQQTETTLPFIVSSKLLQPGLLDFSAEIGMPRLQYGLRSSIYADEPAASGSARYGVNERITLLAHGEGSSGFGGGGLGAVVGLGSLGLLSAAGSGSWRDGSTGAQAYAAFETRFRDISFLASTQRSFGNYQDLASVTASPIFAGPNAPVVGDYVATIASADAWTRFLLPPRALDRLSVGFPMPIVGGGLNFGFARAKDVAGRATRIVNASYTRALPSGGSFYATVFSDLEDRGSAGIFAGLSFPFGGNIVSSAGATRSGSAWAFAADVAKPIQQESGSVGWRIRDVEGASGQGRRSASLAYRGDYGQIEGGIAQSDNHVSGTMQLDGAIAAAGGGVFLANRIDDAFAIAKVGAPDVDVLFENRVVARTNASGSALIPSLRSYQANRISIDPRGLPVTAVAETTQEVTAPPDRAGVVVDFGVRSAANAAIVILHGRDGKPLGAGLRGALLPGLRGTVAQAPGFAVGYDGRAFIEHLGPENEVGIRLGDGGECRARFAFAPRENIQVTLGPVPCQ
ncbi:fimbrial biogenesis outer membrane usher protein [Bosea caraganae]|uniref:Fimbrial biogenesis outer membrane usher protein n=1 Tax=Bosea caraganae TaxID=2763117 RepID=A0A370LA24_9HYPH|nr:fimbria/pilus outer membrane usher protein [Bosea caraganae]RDJ26832.1 fimbrial biogenesis outer membrane usher protein [Bosea caraganae]RDJ30718.1 fimbrial biogenesis outer membrane usher protein [Bosea caraganae]